MAANLAGVTTVPIVASLGSDASNAASTSYCCSSVAQESQCDDAQVAEFALAQLLQKYIERAEEQLSTYYINKPTHSLPEKLK